MATFLFLSGIARPEILGRRELGGQVETIASFEISERYRFLYSSRTILSGVQQLKTILMVLTQNLVSAQFPRSQELPDMSSL